MQGHRKNQHSEEVSECFEWQGMKVCLLVPLHFIFLLLAVLFIRKVWLLAALMWLSVRLSFTCGINNCFSYRTCFNKHLFWQCLKLQLCVEVQSYCLNICSNYVCHTALDISSRKCFVVCFPLTWLILHKK
jgi:hypothetical protein